MKILIIPNYKKEQTNEALKKAIASINSCSAEYDILDLSSEVNVNSISDCYDIVLYIGGDGTFIKSASIAYHLDIPMIGINTGEIGYLSKIAFDEIEKSMLELCCGNFEVVNEEVLCVKYNENIISPIINDVVFASTELVNNFTVTRDNLPILNTRASAVSFCTAVGSTGLNRSAGGAVILAGTNAIGITPICPQCNDKNSIICDASRPLVVESIDKMNVVIDGENAFTIVGKVSVLSASRSLKVIK